MSVNIHATCVVLAGAAEPFGAPPDAGVLLLGKSGSGKSETALRLIERGARLVSDDRTELFMDGGRVMARAATELEGLLEIRGVGIVKLPSVSQASIALAVEMVAESEVPRLPEPLHYERPAGLGSVPELRIPLLRLCLAPSTPAKIAAAAATLARPGPRLASHLP